MFVLHIVADTVRVPPTLFGKNWKSVLRQLLDAKFANKVMADVGLCICVFDFVNVGDSYTYQGDGAAHVEVKFRLVIFRPFEGEILQGMVKYCTKDRIVITLGFFEDIILPADALPHPSQFDEKEKMWVWDYNNAEKGEEDQDADDANDEQGQDAGFYIWPKQKIRFRVTSIRYNSVKADVKPVIHGNHGNVLGKVQEQERERSYSMMSTSSCGGQGQSSETASPNYDSNAPLSLLVSIKDNGLGPVEWWPSDEDEEEGEAEGEAEA